MKKMVILLAVLIGSVSVLSLTGCAGTYEGYEGRNPSGGHRS